MRIIAVALVLITVTGFVVATQAHDRPVGRAGAVTALLASGALSILALAFDVEVMP